MVLEIVELIALVAGSFVATNLDNLLLLVVLLAATARFLPILAGYVLSSLVILAISTVGVALGDWLEPGAVGYLGVIPIGLGLYTLQRRGSDTEVAIPGYAVAGAGAGAGAMRLGMGSFALMLGNSGDSLALLVPLLAESSRQFLPAVLASWVMMALLFAGLALYIGANERLAKRIDDRGSLVIPWVMVAVGLYILLDTATDTL
jgi:cadmium resistance protein CadD (predicted permease)